MAVGAGPGQIGSVVLRLTTRLLAMGIALGTVGSVVMARLLARQLWNTSPYDLEALAAAIGVIVLVALAACYVPARRAMRVDPMTALRHE